MTNKFGNQQISTITPFVISNQPSADVERATSLGPGGCSSATDNLTSPAMYRTPGVDGLIHLTYSLDDSSVAAYVGNAADMWNSTSATTGVVLELAPPGARVDLAIKFDSGGAESLGCAAYDPAKISIFYSNAWKTSFTPVAAMAHELGHFLGLADAGTYPSQPTIMNNALPGSCSLLQNQTTIVQGIDAASISVCHSAERSYMQTLQKTQAVFDSQRNTNQYKTVVYPPNPPAVSQTLSCTYTYSVVNFYVDGAYDSSEQFLDTINCAPD